MLKSVGKNDRIVTIFTVLPALRCSNEFFLMTESLITEAKSPSKILV